MGIKKSRARVIVVFLQVILLAVAIVLAHGGTSAKADADIQITGTLTTNSGSDVSDVSVYATDPGTDNVEFGPVTSADDGTYDLPVEAGSYDIHFDPPASDNMSSITDSGVMVVDDQTINEQFTAPNYTYSGILTDQNGDPLSNIQIVLISTTGGPTEVDEYTGSTGAFSVSAPAGTYTVQFNDEGYNRNGPQVIGQADVSDFSTGPITTIDLTDGSLTQNFAVSLSQVTIVVKDSSGNPEQGVRIGAGDADGTFTVNDGSVTYTPSDGGVTGFQTTTGVNSAPAGTAVVLIPSGSVFPAATASSGTHQGICVTYNDGTSACNTDPVSVNGDMTVEFDEPPTYTYSGMLTDQYGNPSLAGSEVVLIPVGGSTRSTASVDTNGQFSITVPEGTYNVELENTSGEALATYATAPITAVDLTHSNQTQNLSLPLARVTVEVKGASGNPEGQRVVGSGGGSANATITSDGTTYNTALSVGSPGAYTDEYGSVAILFPVGTMFSAAPTPTTRGNGICVDYTDNVYNCSTIPLTISADTSLFFEEGSTVVQAIAAPANISITPPPTGQNPVLTWNSVNGAVSYNIYRQGTEIGSTTSTSFTDTTATPGGYQYYVTAVDENGAESAPSDSVSEIVYTGPIITSADSTSVGENSSLDFIVTTSGNPTPSVSEIGTLPSGVYFSHDNDGVGELYGSPATGTSGSYPITLIASNAYGASSTQNFVLEVTSSPPSITSAASYEVNARDWANFTVTTTGDPVPSITESGNIPTGLTFTDNGDGTATFAGQASPANDGSYSLTITATNGADSVSQNFTLTIDDVNSVPTFISPTSDTEEFGQPMAFTVDTTGDPVPTITKSITMPDGLTWTDNKDGTATIAGTSSDNASGNYTFTFTAKNNQGKVTQTFVLTITKAPLIKDVSGTSTTVDTPYDITIGTKGYTTPALSESGNLPTGVTFTDNGNSTATIAGTPPTGSGGSYPLTITAINASGTVIKNITLTVDEVPTITSADSASATQGTAFSFQATATGFPTPSFNETGALPKGIKFTNSTGAFSGTAGTGTAGTYPVVITAKNSQSTAPQSFVLTVQ